ncbi:toprim domain-containing protein [Macromonas bipunctata]|uniref:toprim domain-containing protein n=1 Tax=Macromonas bipunctata TaxID=183670 RepID=UPI001F0B9852|nr:toprim domain-containing protein [Macromonas bipunctata]
MIRATLLDAMRAAGLAPAKDLPAVGGGVLHRYRVEGDKPGSLNGWVSLHDDERPAFANFGSWKTGEQHHWRDGGNNRLTVAEQTELKRRMAAAKAACDAEEARVQAEARAKAERLWGRATQVDTRHPYLAVKGFVPPYGLRQLGDTLLVPARDTAGTLHTLQFIKPDERKRFLKDGRIKGCYHAIGQVADKNALLLCEGFATGASLAVTTGYAVAVCLAANNLLPVGLALRAKFPDVRMVVCADRDAAGLNAAHATARAIGAAVAVPPSVKTAKQQQEAAHGPQ